MSLDGLRAWIGEVERKLAMRTRVFLVLTVIAIGVGAAGVYLAIDARDNSVSKDDVRELQQQLEAQIGETAANKAAPPVEEPQATLPEPETVEPEPGKKSKPGQKGAPSSATGGAASANELQELVEAAKQRQAEQE
jgi:hypothetical protein